MTTRRDARPPARAGPPAPGAGDLRGQRWAVLAVAAFFGGSVLAVHLLDPLEPPAAAAAVERAARASPAREVAPAARDGAQPHADAAADAAVAPVPVAAAAPVDGGAPAKALDPDRARAVNACVERAVRDAGEVAPTAPGRWPAVKRARERLRQRRLAARAECERALAL